MTESPIDLDEALDIAIQVASALVASHRVKIVHRDIKPENIMIRREDRLVKVLDFGLAKTLEERGLTAPAPDASTRLLINTAPGVVMGTVAYMSPEQARGIAVDERTDIWSVGVVLYEMIAGKVPFSGTGANEIISQILSRDELMPLERFTHNLPAELDRIVTKVLTKDREERYQSAKDLLIDLKRLRQRLVVEAELERAITPEVKSVASVQVSGEAVVASPGETVTQTAAVKAIHPTTSAEYIVTEIKRHKRGVLLGLAVSIIAGVGVGYWLYKFIGHRSSPSGAMKITRLTTTGRATSAAISPDGKYVAYSQTEAGEESLWLSQVAISSSVRIVPPAAVTYRGITFSPDGNLIFYVIEQTIRARSISPRAGRRRRKKTTRKCSQRRYARSDGKRFAFVRKYPATGRRRADGGKR